MKIAYVSNLQLTESSGGWSGINVNIYSQLSKYFSVDYLGPINPNFVLHEKVLAKLARELGLKSDFSFFSEKRLNKIKDEFSDFSSEDNDAYFFFGNTPWIKIKPNKPYYVYMDADFITYLKVFSEFSKFSEKSIARIAAQEKQWLKNATAIFFGSNWILNETIKNLGLTKNLGKHFVVNTGGHIPIPNRDGYHYNANSINLLFIALNFEKKGGYDAVKIFQEIKKVMPNTLLNIIGEKPPVNVLEINDVRYLGRLSKSVPDELKQMEQAFQNASFLVHPTKMDTMGAIIPEANYFGTPAVASNLFGVPDLIQNERTGFLITQADNTEIISAKLVELFKNKSKYLEMRAAARQFSIDNYSWDAIAEKIKTIIYQK